MSKEEYNTSCSSDEYHKFNKMCDGYDFLPTVLPPVKRLVAIGDLHGDWDMTVRTLRLAKLIDDNMNWSGEDTVVVQVGDQVDRCRPYKKPCNQSGATINDEGSDIKIMEFFTNLHKQALACGGAVYSLLGNHEIMNAEGNMGYVSYEGIRQFDGYVDPKTKAQFPDGMRGRIHAFKPGNQYASFMACTRQAAIIIGSCIFVHAGLLPQYLRDADITSPDSLKKINDMVRGWLLGKVTKEHVAKIVSSQKYSMFWTRVLGSLPRNLNLSDNRCKQFLEPALKLMKVDHMIVGHTPQFYANKEGINSSCDQKLWKVDHGSSGAFDHWTPENPSTRKAQILEIMDDTNFNVIVEN